MLPKQMLYGRVLIDSTDVVRRSVAELVRKMTGTKELAQALEVEGRVVHCPESEVRALARTRAPKKSLALCDSLGLEDEFGGPHERSGAAASSYLRVLRPHPRVIRAVAPALQPTPNPQQSLWGARCPLGGRVQYRVPRA